jgi:hypothetical protein
MRRPAPAALPGRHCPTQSPPERLGPGGAASIVRRNRFRHRAGVVFTPNAARLSGGWLLLTAPVATPAAPPGPAPAPPGQQAPARPGRGPA